MKHPETPANPALSVERLAAAAAVDAENPWPGLATFTEDQRAYFHGRDEEILDLTQLAERRPLVVLFGQSGLGKSSILQAGVFPRLRVDGFCPIYVRLDHAETAPSPTEQIKEMVRSETAKFGTWTKPAIAKPGETLWEFFHHRDDRLVDRDGLGVVPVLVFDQFEELFTLGAARGERRERAVAFIRELAELVENRPSAKLVARLDQSSEEMDAFDFGRTDYRVIISLREDFLPDLETLKTIMPALMQKRMRLGRMTGKQALEAVLKPGGALVEPDVARAIVEFVAGARGGSAERLEEVHVEPALLSVVCRELNERRRAKGQAKITREQVSGDRREILSDFYERSVADLPEAMRRFVEDKLLTKSGFRDNLALEAVLDEPGVTREWIDTLVARRLLRIEDRIGTQRVELTHDVLAEVIRVSRDSRQAREALETEERRRRETEAQLARARRSLWRARTIAVGCGVLTIAAAASAGFGFINLRRARQAEAEAVNAATAARAAEKTQAQLREQADADRRVTAVALDEAEAVLGFSLRELGQELDDYGHLPLLLQVAKKALAYYENLPLQLHTPTMRGGHARALGSLSYVLFMQGQGDAVEGRDQRQQGLRIFEEIERAGALTNAMRIDYATMVVVLAWESLMQRQFLEAVPVTERAEAIVRPVLDDPKLCGLGLLGLGNALNARGSGLLGLGRFSEAASVLQVAVTTLEEAERLPPYTNRPGLRGSFPARMLCQIWDTIGRRRESAELNAKIRADLKRLIAREPFLAEAKNNLAACDFLAVQQLMRDWKFAEFRAVHAEAAALYDELLKLNPKNWPARNECGFNWARLFGYNFRRGDFVAAEAAARKGFAYLKESSETPAYVRHVAMVQFDLARFYAATGRNGEAEQELAEAERLVLVSRRERSNSSTTALQDALYEEGRRNVENARLNWAAVRRNAEKNTVTLDSIQVPATEELLLGQRRQSTHHDYIAAAFHLGDYAGARAALKQSRMPDEIAPRESDSMEDRFNHVKHQLTRVHVLHRAGETAEARAILGKLWSEIDAVFAAAPDELFTQVQMARALWIRAEVESASEADRRRWLQRAAAYLRPAQAAGKLTRYEREVLLNAIEAALSAASVDRASAPATPSNP